ncbi:MAG: hypothetical protein JWO73_234 [Candidatus Taylorbacteria bacterium]|nr:hypothetical protein [Candidatus Taylorbacteria bacterium]
MLRKLNAIVKTAAANQMKRASAAKKSLKKITMCKKCHTFFYRNSWRFESPSYLNDVIDDEIPVRFTQCLACMEQDMALANSY